MISSLFRLTVLVWYNISGRYITRVSLLHISLKGKYKSVYSTISSLLQDGVYTIATNVSSQVGRQSSVEDPVFTLIFSGLMLISPLDQSELQLICILYSGHRSLYPRRIVTIQTIIIKIIKSFQKYYFFSEAYQRPIGDLSETYRRPIRDPFCRSKLHNVFGAANS